MTKGGATATDGSTATTEVTHGTVTCTARFSFNTDWDGTVYRIIMVLGLIVTPCGIRLWDYIIQ